jgi:hypothetical protein
MKEMISFALSLQESSTTRWLHGEEEEEDKAECGIAIGYSQRCSSVLCFVV